MALQADKTKDQRDAASIAREARELFGEWAAEEQADYRDEVSLEEFKREIDSGRPPHNRPFRESSWVARIVGGGLRKLPPTANEFVKLQSPARIETRGSEASFPAATRRVI